MIGMFSYPVDEPTGRPTAQEMWRGSSIQGKRQLQEPVFVSLAA